LPHYFVSILVESPELGELFCGVLITILLFFHLPPDEPDPTSVITYQVELPRFSGPLGISLSGSDQPFEPIFIAALTSEGLAEK